MKICGTIKNNNVDFMAVGQSYINNISEKRQITKDYGDFPGGTVV